MNRFPARNKTTEMTVSFVVVGVWCIMVANVTSFRPHPSTSRPRSFVLRSFLRMDDEVARPNIKEELTTREEYLDTRFKRLSSSGHDLTPIDTVNWIMLILSGANLDFLGVSTNSHYPVPLSPYLQRTDLSSRCINHYR